MYPPRLAPRATLTRIIARCTVLLAALLAPSAARAQGPVPVWEARWVPWELDRVARQSWRGDERLSPFGIADYPDDFRVVFANPDTTGPAQSRFEHMWVRIIARDSASDSYLGYLLNQPHFIRTVRQGDNVVVAVDERTRFILAHGPATDYSAIAWPADGATATGRTIRTALGHYRMGNDGHVMPEIERCIATLSPALEGAARDAWQPARDQRFIAHFVLGRCLAERYHTERALAQFRAAVALDSTDLDAQLATLAELSVLVHAPRDSANAASRTRWDAEFLRQLSVVRTRFGDDSDVRQVLGALYDPAHEKTVAPEHRHDIERLRRIGFATFRWKRR